MCSYRDTTIYYRHPDSVKSRYSYYNGMFVFRVILFGDCIFIDLQVGKATTQFYTVTTTTTRGR